MSNLTALELNRIATNVLKASEVGELDQFLFSHPRVQEYLTGELNIHPFRLFREVLLEFVSKKLGCELSGNDLNGVLSYLPSNFCFLVANSLRKERLNY